MSNTNSTTGLKQLSPTDGLFFNSESRRTPEHIGVVNIYDPSTANEGFVRFKDILRHFETRVQRSAIFTRKLKKVPFNLDYPYWVEAEDFDLEYHVRHIALPKPGDWRQLCIQVARLHALPLDFDRPLWTAYVIEGLENIARVPKGSFAIHFKLHHAVADGMAALEFLQATHDFTPIFPSGNYGDENLHERKVEKQPSTGKLLLNSYKNSWKQPIRLAKLGADIAPRKRREKEFREKHGLHKPEKKPTTRFSSPVSSNRVYGALEFDLKQVEEIRKAVEGMTINDVAVALVSRALRHYLIEKDDLPSTSLTSIVPVSLRQQSEAGEAGNAVSALIVPIHTNIDDPMELLEKVSKTLDLAKQERVEIGQSLIMEFMNSVPSATQRTVHRLAERISSLGIAEAPANMSISNVPGIPVPVYLAGAKMVKTHALGLLQHGAGIFHAITSYNNELCVSFLACREQLPDPDVYSDCIKQAFSDIFHAAMNKTSSTSKTRSKAKPKTRVKAKPKAKTAPKPKAKTAPKPKAKRASKPKTQRVPKPSSKSKSANI